MLTVCGCDWGIRGRKGRGWWSWGRPKKAKSIIEDMKLDQPHVDAVPLIPGLSAFSK